MRIRLARFWISLLVVLMFMSSARCESLQGESGASLRWGSGWLDLNVMTSFKRGDKIKLKVGGTAKNIVVRFLSKNDAPTDAVGIDGGVVSVADNRTVEITLSDDHSDVIQISVHGGPNPWDLYDLGQGNGPATILSAERVTQ